MGSTQDEARLELIGQVLKRITYKPTATLHWDGYNLEINDTYPHSRTLEPKLFTWCAGSPPEILFEVADHEVPRLVAAWVLEQCALTEMHEVAEFVKLDGYPPFDPHDGLAGSEVCFALSMPGYHREMEPIP